MFGLGNCHIDFNEILVCDGTHDPPATCPVDFDKINRDLSNNFLSTRSTTFRFSHECSFCCGGKRHLQDCDLVI